MKLLICEQEDKNYPKLTIDAANRFEIEKQNQIKQYMEDIIIKLQQKERKFKVTVKKKFIDDALYNSTSIRVASVYVIVVNREKTFDPVLQNKIKIVPKKCVSDLKHNDESSEEDEEHRLREHIRRTANPNLINAKKQSLYDSDAQPFNYENMNSTQSSQYLPAQFKKLLQEKTLAIGQDPNFAKLKAKTNSTGPIIKRQYKDELGYKYA